MSINIEMQIKQSNSTYETLYPSTLGSLVSGKVSSASQADSATSATSATTSALCTGNSATATKLQTARSLRVSLSSTSTQSFDGSSNATSIGVNGTLPVSNGGTGVNNLDSLKSNFVTKCKYDRYGYTGDGQNFRDIVLTKTYPSNTILGNSVSRLGNPPYINGKQYAVYNICSIFKIDFYDVYDVSNLTTIQELYRGGANQVSVEGNKASLYYDRNNIINENGVEYFLFVYYLE